MIYLFITFYWAVFYSCPEGKGTRALQGAIRRCPTSPTPPFAYERQPQHRDHPTIIRIVRGFFNVPQSYQHSRNCETGPPAYRPYPRKTRKSNRLYMKLQRQHFSPQLFKDPECWSGRSLGVSNSRPPARHSPVNNQVSHRPHNMYTTSLPQLYDSFKTIAHRIIIKLWPFLQELLNYER